MAHAQWSCICLPPMWPGFDSRTRRQMWVEFVVGSRPCSERFFSGYSGFPLSSKTISKFTQGHTLIGTTLYCVFLAIVRCKLNKVFILKLSSDCFECIVSFNVLKMFAKSIAYSSSCVSLNT